MRISPMLLVGVKTLDLIRYLVNVKGFDIHQRTED